MGPKKRNTTHWKAVATNATTRLAERDDTINSLLAEVEGFRTIRASWQKECEEACRRENTAISASTLAAFERDRAIRHYFVALIGALVGWALAAFFALR